MDVQHTKQNGHKSLGGGKKSKGQENIWREPECDLQKKKKELIGY